LSRYALSSRKDVIYKGLGILPIKSHCHHREEDNIEKLDKLEGELLLLKEGEYQIIER
jgi:hypothetical protein